MLRFAAPIFRALHLYLFRPESFAMSHSRKAEMRRFLSPEQPQSVSKRGLYEYVTTRVPIALYHRIDSFAVAQGAKRSEALRVLIERGLRTAARSAAKTRFLDEAWAGTKAACAP